MNELEQIRRTRTKLAELIGTFPSITGKHWELSGMILRLNNISLELDDMAEELITHGGSHGTSANAERTADNQDWRPHHSRSGQDS